MKTLRLLLVVFGLSLVAYAAETTKVPNPTQVVSYKQYRYLLNSSSVPKMRGVFSAPSYDRLDPVRIFDGKTNYVCALWDFEDRLKGGVYNPDIKKTQKPNPILNLPRPLPLCIGIGGRVLKVLKNGVIIAKDYKEPVKTTIISQSTGKRTSREVVVGYEDKIGPRILLKNYPHNIGVGKTISCYAFLGATEDVPDYGVVRIFDYGQPVP